jgi:hypothetical protein
VTWRRRRLLQVLAAAPALGCRRDEPKATLLEQALLAVAAEGGFGGTESQRNAATEIGRLVRRVRDAAGGGPLDSEVLRRTLFTDLGFVRVVEGLTCTWRWPGVWA